MTVISLALTTILADPDLQPRVGGLDPAHIRSLEETPDAWPPLVVVQQGAEYLLIDGFHRLAAAQNLGRETIVVEIIDPPADGDLRALAFNLNLHHGRPLTLADRRAYATHVLRNSPELSDRAIGEMTALSGNTVTAIRRELETRAQIERPTERIGRGGYAYREPDRQPGEMPDQGIGASLGGVAARLFSSAERQKQRMWASYFQRVATAVDDQFSLPQWDENEEMAQACRLVLGDEKAEALGKLLGPGVDNLLAVALALGYDPENDKE